jgi:hypothetical protein
MRVFVLLLLAGLLAVGLFVVPGVGSADPNLPNVPAHRHFLVKGTGADIQYIAEVGPDLCDNPNVQNAFNEYHFNHHVAGSASIGPVAPGLHNGQETEIVARPCSFHMP